MKRFIIAIMLMLSAAAFSEAADKTKALLAIENARIAVTKLEQHAITNQMVADDIVLAKAYLQKAETIYKDNISWLLLGNLNDAAEPQVRNYAEMAEISAGIGLSRIEKANREAERKQLVKEIDAARAKVKVFEDKAAEVSKLKREAGKYDVVAQEVGALKAQLELYKADKLVADKLRQDNAELLKQLEKVKSQVATLAGQLETLKMEKASIGGQIEAMSTDKKVSSLQIKKQNERIVALETELVSLRQKKDEAIQSQKQLSSVQRSIDFRSELSKLGALTEITDTSFALVLPRQDIIKTTPRGFVLAPDVDKNMQPLLALIQSFPEYALSLKVFGFGKPTRVEGQRSADQMAKMVRDYFALKLGKKSDSIASSGGTAPSPLFSSKAKESNKRIELTFTLQDTKNSGIAK